MSELDPVILNEVTKVSPPILGAMAQLSSDVKKLPTTPIGCMQFMPDLGVDFTDASGSYYLRTGFAAPAASYPDAAALDHVKVSGLAATGSPTTIITQAADNGAGTIVACYNNSTNVLVSTDNGITWTAVAHALPNSAVAVAWTGTHFVVASNSNLAISVAYSTNGLAFTFKSTTTLSGSTASINTVRAAWNGSVIVIIGCDATDCCVTAPSATGTYTKRTLPVAIPSGTDIAFAVSGLTILFNIGGATTSADTYSTTDGITYTKRTWPSNVNGVAFIGGLWLAHNNPGTRVGTRVRSRTFFEHTRHD